MLDKFAGRINIVSLINVMRLILHVMQLVIAKIMTNGIKNQLYDDCTAIVHYVVIIIELDIRYEGSDT